MANDNNNIKQLVAESEEDPTAELRSIPDRTLRDYDALDDAGSDEDTCSFDRLERSVEVAGHSVASLKSIIQSRNESISRLQFDNEQLRSRWSGLDKEIGAREDLTVALNEKLSGSRRKLDKTKALLSEKEKSIGTLQQSLRKKNTTLASFEKEARNASATVDSGKSLVNELQNKLVNQNSALAELIEKSTTAANAKLLADEVIGAKDKRNSELEEELSRQLVLASSDSKKRSQLESRYYGALQEIEELRTSRTAKMLAAEQQDGHIAGQSQEIGDLKRQIARTESYADDTRDKLRTLEDSTNSSSQAHHHLEVSLAGATSQMHELQQKLDREALLSKKLREKNEQLQREFEKEIKLVRFELGGAEQTIADQESLNEKLASDLLDNQGYRQALEVQIDNSNKESRKKIKDLSRKLKKLEYANEEIERKLENKDNAVAALLSELASRSRTIESDGESGNTIHEIDGHISEQDDDIAPAGKDRMARLLIGNVEGQELQFPLFKDRLTIGRTVRNDIQLNAHFISRRHAVIVTDAGRTRIIDWGSKNGVYVNDSRIAEQFLKNGDVVAIGTAEFRYEERPKR